MPKIKIPTDFECSISHQIMLDPVSDELGENYEREEIEHWFKECQDKQKPLTSPCTNESLSSDRLTPARAIKRQITEFLDKNPQCWEEVYMSKKVIEDFKQALIQKDKSEITKLVKTEPRLATLNDYELVKWVIREQALDLLKESIMPSLAERGQKERVPMILLLLVKAKWLDGMRLLIAKENWKEENYYTQAKRWIGDHQKEALNVLLFEMQQQKILLTIADSAGNTLLHEAAKVGNGEIIDMLLIMGMDSSLKNAAGETPQDIAANHTDPRVLTTFTTFQAQSQNTGGPNPQLQALQHEVQDLKFQLATLEKQNQQSQQQLFTALRYTAPLFFNFVNENSKKYVVSERPKIFSGFNVNGPIIALSTKQILSGEGSALKVWDIDTGKCLKTISSDNKKYIFEGIILLSPEKAVTWGSSSYLLHPYPGSPHSMMSRIIYENDNKKTVYAIQIWDIESGKCLRTIDNTGESILKVAILSNGLLVSCGSNTLKIWDPNSGTCLKTSRNEQDMESCQDFAVTDEHIVILTKGNIIKVFETIDGKCIRSIKTGANSVSSIAVLPNKDIMLISDHEFVQVWDINEGSCLNSFHKKGVEEVAILSNNHVLLRSFKQNQSNQYNQLSIQSLSNLTVIQSLHNPDNVKNIAVLPDGGVVALSNEGKLYVWESNPILKQTAQIEKAIETHAPQCRMM